MKKSILVLGLWLPWAAAAESRLGYVTFGAMLHWNFSENEFKAFSYGLEASYWNFKELLEDEAWFGTSPDLSEPGYGLDVGLEADWRGIRLYTEPQTGLVLAGVSCGPVLEIPYSGSPARLGIQGSGWVQMIAGFDFRYRRMDGKNFQAVGLSGKLPFLVSGGEGGTEN